MDIERPEIRSPILEKEPIKRQFDILNKTVEDAKRRIDYTSANDREVQKAIEIVERFIRRKRRVCYGGQAINALLSKERQFYDERYSIPDYDFFSPNFKEDTEELIQELRQAGFEDVNKKLSIHDGTSKILINFIPVADCTDLHISLFKIIQTRAKSVNGILYADPDFLRMFMYLEMSRPRGQVDRWKKVYERLVLLNDEYPPGQCSEDIIVAQSVGSEEREAILEFCIKRKRVLIGPECITLMQKGHGKSTMKELVSLGGPVICLSPQAHLDGQDIRDILLAVNKGKGKIEVSEEITLSSEILNFTTVKMAGKPIALIFQEEACHSYSLLHLASGIDVRTGTYDLLLQVYYAIHIFGKKEKAFFQTPVYCLIKKLHAIEARARNKPTSYVPAFGLKCSGHQQGIATLLKERAARTEKEKGEKHALNGPKTRRLKRR